MSEKVWVVFVGESPENYSGSFGPAFTSRECAERFAAANDGQAQEFEVCGGAAASLTAYRCNGWLHDPYDAWVRRYGPIDAKLREGLFAGLRQHAGYWIQEGSWDSWDVLTPEAIDVEVCQHDGSVRAKGRDRESLLAAVVKVLDRLNAEAVCV